MLARAGQLEARAAAEIKKLTTAGKTTEAATLQREERLIQSLSAELETAHGEGHLRRIENDLSGAEMKIEEELKRLEQGENKTTAALATTTKAPATTTQASVTTKVPI